MTDRRRLLIRMVVRCMLTAIAAFSVYAFLPVNEGDQSVPLLRLVVAMSVFFAAAGWQVYAIMHSARPVIRAIESLTAVLVLLIVMFAYSYLSLSASDPQAFSAVLDHPAGIYFTITVLSTVGFGDIVPVSDPARLVVSIQMILDLLVVGFVVRVLVTAAQRGAKEKGTLPGLE